jgi:hypothetical protein
MSSVDLTITLQSPTSAASQDWVHLEQPGVNSNRITRDDFERMLALVLTGNSAHQYMQPDCPAVVGEESISTDLTFFSWPSRLDLPYTIGTELTVKGSPVSVRLDREFDAVARLSDVVDLPYFMEGIIAFWQTPCYNRLGEWVDPAIITPAGSRLLLSAEVFGVLRVIGTARGSRHTLTLQVPKTAATKITDLKPTVSALWGLVREDGTQENEQLELEIPGCVEDLLAVCPDGELVRSKVTPAVASTDPTIYYSTCDGSVLEVRYEQQ